jgi:hypothetical protein
MVKGRGARLRWPHPRPHCRRWRSRASAGLYRWAVNRELLATNRWPIWRFLRAELTGPAPFGATKTGRSMRRLASSLTQRSLRPPAHTDRLQAHRDRIPQVDEIVEEEDGQAIALPPEPGAPYSAQPRGARRARGVSALSRPRLPLRVLVRRLQELRQLQSAEDLARLASRRGRRGFDGALAVSRLSAHYCLDVLDKLLGHQAIHAIGDSAHLSTGRVCRPKTRSSRSLGQYFHAAARVRHRRQDPRHDIV